MLLVLSLLVLTTTSTWAQSTTPKPTHKPRPTKPPAPDVVTVLKAKGYFNTLLDLVTKAGLVDTLLSAPNLTLFAPTDDAFARLPAGTLQALGADPNKLQSVLMFHATAQAFNFHHKWIDSTLTSLDNGLPIRLSSYGTLHTVAVEGVNTTERGIPIKNGYLHVLDGVMMPPEGNVVELIENNPKMTQMTRLLVSTGLKDVMRNDMNITVFVPNDDAFAAVPDKVINYLLANVDDLKEVLLYHVVSSRTLYSIEMKHSLTFPSSDKHHDRVMTIEDDSNNIYINDALLIDRDISATNGVMHVINKVLIPARILIKIESQGIVVAPELTLFAPTDDALAKLPPGTLQEWKTTQRDVLLNTLKYHAIPQTVDIHKNGFSDKTVPSMLNNLPVRINTYKVLGVQSVDGVKILNKRYPITNGLIYGIDDVMSIPQGDVIAVVANKNDTQRLSYFLKSSGLDSTISNDHNITVFVPSDDAFNAVDQNVINYLLGHPDDFKDVLLYHVVTDKTVYSIGMKHTLTFETADHSKDHIMIFEDTSNNIIINNAKIIEDISATNGVIHIIDKVLIPANILLKMEDHGLTIG